MALAVVALGGARRAAAQAVTLRDGAREVAVSLASLPRRVVAVHDPTDGGRARTLVGVALADVLERLPAPPGADTLAVRCDDGWLSLLPLATVRRMGPILATEEKGERRGAVAAALVPPRGPVFLVWPNVATPAVDRDPVVAAGGWTFGTSSLEYVKRAEALAPTEPRAGGPLAREGAALFQKHCMHCHAVRGAGGMVGWDLARPSIVAARGEARVRAYVLDPRRLNPDGKMPAFRGRLGAGELKALVAYLAAFE